MHDHVVHDHADKLLAGVVVHRSQDRRAERNDVIPNEKQHERLREFFLRDHRHEEAGRTRLAEFEVVFLFEKAVATIQAKLRA